MLDLDRSKTATPFALDFMRAAAAQMVCVGHAMSFVGASPASVPILQNVGVLLFFVMSGFLITRVLISRSRSSAYGFPDFFLDRFARIYSALIPSLAIIFLIDGLTIHATGDPSVARYFTAANFTANALLFNGYRGTFESALQWAPFGSAGPMWTLSIEWHIYLFVGAIFFMSRRPLAALYLVPIAIIYGQVPSHYIFGNLDPSGIGQSLFALWLGGALIALAGDTLILPKPVSIAVLVAAVMVYLKLVGPGHEYTPATYPLVVAAVAMVIFASQHMKPIRSARLSSAVTFAADYSFTLYLIHYPVLMAFRLLWTGGHWPHIVLPIIVSNLIAALVAIPTEMKHRRLAHFLKSLFGSVRNSRAMPEAATAGYRPEPSS